MNQYQALLLIPLLNLHIPKNVRDFIIGNDITLFSFSFLDVNDISFITDLNYDLGNYQDNEYLKEIGIQSNSVIINHLSLIIVYLAVFLLHLMIWLLAGWIKSKSVNNESKCNKFMSKVLRAFTFGIYIRFLLESFEFMMLCANSEIKLEHVSSKYHIISYSFAWIVLIFCVMIVLFNIYDWLHTRNEDKIETEKYFSQLYDGLKPKFACRSYSIIMLSRRSAFIYITLFLQI